MAARQTAKRNNKLYVQAIVSQLRAKTRKTQALMLIMGFRAAINATWQDSGQFASNWRVSLRSGSFDGPVFNKGQPPIGKSGEQRSTIGGERPAKDFALTEAGVNNNNPEFTSLFSQISKGRGGMPRMSIYNPLFDEGVASGHQTPYPYWYYATLKHSGYHVKEAVRQALNKATAIARSRINSKAW